MTTLTLIRKKKTPLVTIGDLFINDEYFCKTLEDTDRDLDQSQPLAHIQKIKVKAKTAIPRGTYELKMTHSPKYGRIMPELMKVPGYTGIRIHPGNTADHTEGCILVGLFYENEKLVVSKAVFDYLYEYLSRQVKKGPVQFIIKNGYHDV